MIFLQIIEWSGDKLRKLKILTAYSHAFAKNQVIFHGILREGGHQRQMTNDTVTNFKFEIRFTENPYQIFLNFEIRFVVRLEISLVEDPLKNFNILNFDMMKTAIKTLKTLKSDLSKTLMRRGSAWSDTSPKISTTSECCNNNKNKNTK